MRIDTTTDRLIRLALEEDLGPGDVTTRATIPSSVAGRGVLFAKADLVAAGTALVAAIYDRVDPTLQITMAVADGDRVARGTVLGTIEGSAAAILTGERVALNFLQRLCGVATFTRRCVEEVAGTGARVVDTRKTTPGWRLLEKEAVRAGGGTNHRIGLFDGILIKDNHIEAAGGITEAIRRARQAHYLLCIEVEVEDMDGVREALDAGADVIMLDNMSNEQMREAVQLIDGRARVEASGGITLQRLRSVAETGVDYISLGALTHSAPAVDISLDLEMQR